MTPKPHSLQQTSLLPPPVPRYDIEDCACVAGARQLTALALQHCSLADGSLQGLAELTSLRHLQLADNFLTTASLTEVARLEQLVSE